MKYRLLELLVCPECPDAELELQAFRLDPEQSPQEVLDGILTCARCGKLYPVVAGIPRLLPDSYHEHYAHLRAYRADLPEPQPMDNQIAEFAKNHKSTQGSFSYEWLRYQVTDTEENTKFFLDTTGLGPRELRGKRVLDAGCGMGRYLEIAAGWADEVIGIDLSRSVERAWRETAHRSKVHLVQGDIMKPPLKRGSMDFVVSLGVLHHTPDTRRSFQSLCKLLRPEGRISIWVYRTFRPETKTALHKHVHDTVCEWISDATRFFTTRMPHNLLHYFCYASLPLGGLAGVVYRNKLLRHILWPALLVPFSTHEKWQVRLCDTFDWLAPKYQWKHTTQEVMQWFREEGLLEVRSFDKAVSVTGVMAAHSEVEVPAGASGRILDNVLPLPYGRGSDGTNDQVHASHPTGDCGAPIRLWAGHRPTP
jgi:SAM-dependent methyltransferase